MDREEGRRRREGEIKLKTQKPKMEMSPGEEEKGEEFRTKGKLRLKMRKIQAQRTDLLCP